MYELHTTLRPGPYRYELARGMKGTDVAALQLNFPELLIDGDFGQRTQRRVALFQRRHGIEPIGIAGVMTQAKLIAVHSQSAARRYELPRRFLYSKASKESGLKVAAYAKHPNDWGFDLGTFQLAFGPNHRPATQQGFAAAYDIAATAEGLAKGAREDYERFLHGAAVEQGCRYGTELAVGGDYSPQIFAWQLVALVHNWPAAAEHIAALGRAYVEEGRDDRPEDWIVEASGGRLSTPRDWILDYVPGATAYVRW